MNYYEEKGEFLKYLRKTMRIMRLSLFLIIISTAMAFSASSYSQNTKLSLDFNNATVKEILKTIENQSEFLFFYQEKHVDLNRQVTIRANEKNVETILNQLFAGTDNIYVINDRQIVIGKAPRKELEKQINSIKGNVKPLVNQPQQKEITGKVVDEDGLPLPGVTVIVKGTTTGTVTNADGEFKLDIPLDAEVLQFTFVGMKTQEVPIEGRTTFTVEMEEESIGIEEVVAVGYGYVQKSDLTGSVSSISSEELELTPMVSLDQGLQGRAAGVQVMKQSHQPGGGVSIRIRGGNSFTAGNEPLYVVDGFPIYSDNNTFAAGSDDVFGATPNALASLNPNDIESLEILKDASATAIYGSRGANGVVIITTKRGRKGDTRVEFNYYYGISEISKKMNLLNADQFMTILNEARTNSGESAVSLDEPYVNSNTDWQNEVYQTAPTQNFQLNITGGNDATQYALSGNYYDQQGIITNSNFKRGSIRLNVDKKVSERIKVGNSLTYTRAVNNNVITDIYGGQRAGVSTNALLMPPIVPVDTSGVYINTPQEIPGVREDITNPVVLAKQQTNEVLTNRLLSNFFTDIELVNQLTLRVSGGIDYYNSVRNFFSPAILPYSLGRNSGNIVNTQVFTWLNENTLTYDLKVNENHKLNLLAGFTQQTQIRNYYELSGNTFPSDALLTNAMGTAETQRINSSKNRWDLLSWIGRVNYNLKDKYLFTVTFRADGSSKFGVNNKWGYFPSAAFAWRLIEEDFIKSTNLFSDLKFRTSYGITGNQEIGSYQSLSRLNSTNATFNDQLLTAIYPAGPPYANLKWEKTAQYDFGLDIGFFDNRLMLTADLYKKSTDDLLIRLPLPYTGGIPSILRNLGSLTNQGFEIGLRTVNLNGQFTWETDANISFNKNKVTALPGLKNGFDAGSSDPHIQFGTAGRVEIGQPLGNFYGYVTDGIWQTEEAAKAEQFGTEPGEIRYVDTNNDELITPEDRIIIGNAQPDYFFGVTNRFAYKGFDLNIFINGMIGHDILNYQIFEGERLNGANNHFAYVMERWRPDNPSNKVPKATLDRPYLLSDRQIEDGSFIRLQNINLGYTIQTDNISWLSRLRIYVSGQNLALITDYRGYDPEVNSFGQNNNLNLGVDRGAYPASKTYLFGMNLSF